jgi:pimeloyl-ACP methyl ester carboxylesterase
VPSRVSHPRETERTLPTILVAHGALGSAEQMQPVAHALLGAFDGHFAVRVLEFPGHGHTALADGSRFGLPDFVEALARVVDACATPPWLFGYSMGGYVGLALEARAPRRLAGIITLGTKFEWDETSASREAGRLDPVVIAGKVPRFAAALAARHEHAGGWETVVVRTAALLRENGRAPLLSPEVLEHIGIPVTVAVGALDETVSVDESQRAADVLRNGRCVVLPDVAHPIERVSHDTIVSLVKSALPSA